MRDMNRKISLGLGAAMALLLPLLMTGCGKGDASAQAGHGDHSKSAAKKAWHCPMHPQILKDHEDTCPLCGMDLVEFEPGAAASGKASTDSAQGTSSSPKSAGREVQVDPAVLQRIGVRTAMVEAGVVGREIRAEAEGVADEAAEVSVTSRTMGYLETVAAVRSGDRVKAGQILANLNSPELTAAQGDWLAARRSGDSLGQRAAGERLATLGFPAASLANLARTATVQRTVPLTSPSSGWLKARAAVRGQAVMAGAELFRIVEGNGVLLEARLPVAEAALLKANDAAELNGAGLAAPLGAKVVAVLPQVERTSRSATVRLTPAKGGEIRIGALYQARFQAKATTGFVVPQDAVLRSGRREVVFLDLGNGRFRPVEVRTGTTSGGKTLVLEGVEAGDEVVVSAQFLIDGESRLQAALDQMMAGAESTPAGHGSHK